MLKAVLETSQGDIRNTQSGTNDITKFYVYIKTQMKFHPQKSHGCLVQILIAGMFFSYVILIDMKSQGSS